MDAVRPYFSAGSSSCDDRAAEGRYASCLRYIHSDQVFVDPSKRWDLLARNCDQGATHCFGYSVRVIRNNRPVFTNKDVLLGEDTADLDCIYDFVTVGSSCICRKIGFAAAVAELSPRSRRVAFRPTRTFPACLDVSITQVCNGRESCWHILCFGSLGRGGAAS